MDDGPIPTDDADLSGSDDNDNNDEWKWKGDQGMANLVLRLRDSLWYYEMCHAISHGDIGRVMEIVKVRLLLYMEYYANYLPDSSLLLLGKWFDKLWERAP